MKGLVILTILQEEPEKDETDEEDDVQYNAFGEPIDPETGLPYGAVIDPESGVVYVPEEDSEREDLTEEPDAEEKIPGAAYMC